MPIDIKPNETKGQFLIRCIKKEIEYGKSPKQAAGICYAMWKKSK